MTSVPLSPPPAITIDPEFANLLPPLDDDELARLTDSLLTDGCRDPLVTWDGVVVDGHNRYRICQEHKIGFTTIGREFADRAQVKVWMVSNQMARRRGSSILSSGIEAGQ